MSSVKLNSSGGGSVSLSAASTSTDVTITFPSGNSSLNQALVASDSSGTLGWSTVPNSTAVPLLRLASYNTTTASACYVSGSCGLGPLEWYVGNNSNWETDTHSAWDATNYWYVVPQEGYYRVTHSFRYIPPAFVDTTKTHAINSIICRADAANKTLWGTAASPIWVSNFSKRDGDSSAISHEHSAIIECAAGDALKTTFWWDKDNDVNNTTTSVDPKDGTTGNTSLGNFLTIEFVRPL